jgi:SLOG-like protein
LLVEVQRAHSRFAGSPSPRIVSYLPEPLAAEERARYVDTVEFVNVELAVEESAAQTARGRALRLRAMRRQIARDAAAIVVVGGRTSGFSSWRPGIAEEIATAAVAGRPAYLIGGFGGAAAEYAEAVFWRGNLPPSPTVPELGPEPIDMIALPPPGDVVRILRRRGLRNGLSKAENTQLARSVDTDEIVGLVLRGLASVSKSKQS